jgi:hypothetical protein
MFTSLRKIFIALSIALISGCASNAPTYTPSVVNVDAASKLRGNVSVSKFTFKKGEESSLNSVGARAVSFKSPVNGSYADYLAQAVNDELKSAGKLDPNSTNALTGTIERNSLSAAGINTNDAEVAVRFKLQDGAKTNYEKLLTAKHEWESSFLGGIAIPRAIQNYVVTIQKLLNNLYSDPDFVAATRNNSVKN